jgi:hypothetical protein
VNVKFGALNGEQQGLFCGIEEIEAAQLKALLSLGVGQLL